VQYIKQLITVLVTGATGADIAADIIALKAETVEILTDTAEIGAAVGASISADIAAIKAESESVPKID